MQSNCTRKPVWLLLLFVLFPFVAAAQNATVSGTVTDQSGAGLPGVSIVETGTTNGTMSDLDGKFSISVKNPSSLQFSFIGFKNQTVSVTGNQSGVKVLLEEDTKAIDEVVVVGYGQMKRSDLTGSVVSVNDQAIKKSVPTSVDQVLQGRAAGVQIQANSGTPGASSAIRIRGINSLNATNQPIFVIDGVVVDAATDDATNNPLSSINPSDIVTMDVLKDASATAIYGARASNGVIMITTKRGQSGEATITYDGYVGWQEMPKFLDVMNLQEYAEHANARADAGIVSQSSAFVRPDLLGEGTDWQSELFSKAFMQSHNLSITGGNEKTTYAISTGYLNQEGIALGSGFKRISMRGNIESQVKKWLKAGTNFSLADTKQEVGCDNDLIMTALRQIPSVAVRSADGSFDGPDDVWMPDNPVALALIKDNYNKKVNFRMNTYLEAEIIEGLTFKTELSTDYNINKFYYYCPDYQFGLKENTTRTGKWTEVNTRYWSWRNIVTYNKTIDVHNFNLMVGQEMSNSHWEQQVSATTGYISNTAKDISAGDVSKSSGTGTQVDSDLASFFGRLFYSFDNKYLLTATIRRDGSSKFTEDNRWGWFPSAALAWKISSEDFMKGFEMINNLKLRVGWGATGNQNVSNYAYMALLSQKSTPFGLGILNANTANPDLKWETTYSTNIGIDLGLYENRIEFIADYYIKKTKDLLLQLPLPAYLGSEGQGAAANPWANVGELQNTGVEFTLNTVNLDLKGFQWKTNLVFSLNRNKVNKLDTETASIEKTFSVGDDNTVVTKTVEGGAIGRFWGYKVIGRFNTASDFYYKDENGDVKQVAIPEGSSIEENKTWIGDYIFEDVNKDGVINSDDQTFIGDPNPDFTFGFGNTFSYKGFDLTVFLSGSYGNDVINYNNRWIASPRESSNLLTSATDYAVVTQISDNGDTDVRNYIVSGGDSNAMRLSASSTNANNRLSDLYVEDGSYVRIQNVSLAYNFPKNITNRLKVSNLKLYVNIQNLYTFTNYTGYDPEVGCMYGDALMSGLDYGRYPTPRIYTFGVNVSF